MKSLLVVVAVLVSFATTAQETHVCAPPPPRTQIGAFEERTGTVLVKGLGEVGTISCTAGAVSVTCKETTDLISTQKVFGAAVSLKRRDGACEVRLLDYEELEPLAKAIPRINGALWGDTAMSSFEGVWTSKDGLRVVTYNNKVTGAIESAIQTTQGLQITVMLSPAHLESLRALIEQVKAKIDSVRGSTAIASR